MINFTCYFDNAILHNKSEYSGNSSQRYFLRKEK